MLKLKLACAFALAAMMVVPALAEDQPKKAKGKGKDGANPVVTQLLKQLEPVELTEEQIAKVKELGKVAGEKIKGINEAAGITPELMKKKAEAVKSLKDSGKKGKELAAAVNEAAGFTEDQIKASSEADEIRQNFQKEVIALLSDDQKAKLPERMQRGDKTKKKKKDAA
jgi:hypothetical protein